MDEPARIFSANPFADTIMNNKIIVAIAIAAGIAGIWYYTTQPTSEAIIETQSAEMSGTVDNTTTTDNTVSKTSTNTTATEETAQAIPSSVQERMSAIQARRPGLNLDAKTLQAKMAQPTTWTPSEEVPTHLPLKPEEFTDGRQFISLDDLKIETLMPGDQVDIEIPDTKNNYQVTIDSVEKHDYNSISWHGHIDGADGQSYAVSFTRGESLTVAGFSTPDGHYVLQGHGKDGWIASSGLLFKEHTHPINPQDVLDAEAQGKTYDHSAHAHNQ